MLSRIRNWWFFGPQWRWRRARGQCPLGPPPPCPEFEPFEIKGVYQCITYEHMEEPE